MVAAVEFIKEATQEAKTIYIFQLAYSRFPDFDGFVSYRTLSQPMGQGGLGAPTIHGYQRKLTREYPRHAVDTHNIARGWFLRGGKTVNTNVCDGWEFPSVDQINLNLLDFELHLLHPLFWGTVLEAANFEG